MKILSLLATFVSAGVVVLATAGSAAALMSTSGGGWVWSQAQPQGHLTSALDFINASQGWAAGEGGTILYTQDGGATWAAQLTPVDEELRAVSFVDALHGWATSQDHVIATTDGGQHWTRQKVSLSSSLYDIDFGSPLVGAACGTSGIIYRTADGGATWTKVQTPASETLFSVDMLDAQTGWACGIRTSSGHPAILRTVDGGQTWLTQNVPFEYGELRDIQAISASVAVVGGVLRDSGEYSVVCRTTDGGYNWASIGAWDEDGSPNGSAIAFLDSDHGWTFARDTAGSAEDDCSIRYTADGGQSWTSLPTASGGWSQEGGNSWHGGCLVCLDADHVVLASRSTRSKTPGIYTSSDAGQTWTTMSRGWGQGFAFAASFPTASDGWVAANATDSSAPNGRYDILHTSDGGATWEGQYLQTPTSGYIYDIDFVDSQTGWAAGARTLARTTDGGATWTQQAVGYDVDWQGELRAIDFCDATHGLAVGRDGLVIRTSDGSFWANATLPTGYQTCAFFGVGTVDTNHAWIVGEDATILTTNDGGETWTSKAAPAAKGNDLLGTFWLDATHGWAVGKESTIIKTTDGGKTWTAQSAGPFSGELLSVSFADSKHGWAVGNTEGNNLYGALVLKTDDGGTTWKAQGVGCGGISAYDVIALDAETSFICAGVNVLKTTTGGVSPIESAAPTVTLRKPSGTWHNHDVKVTVAASDASGIKHTWLNVDGSYPVDKESITVDSVSDGEGLHTVQVAAMDMVGNGSAPKTLKIGIDTKKPTKTWPLNHPSVARGGTTTLKYRIYDPTPGCGKAKVTLMIATKTRVIKKVSIGTVATNKTISYRYRCGLARGTYYWGVSATDIAGNKVSTKNIWVWTLTVR